jgi:hypothetical protein
MLLLIGYWYLGDQLAHVVHYYVFRVRMYVRVEGSVHESHMYLILYYIELLLIFFRAGLTECLRNLCLTQSNHSFVLKIRAERYFDETFVGSNTQN